MKEERSHTTGVGESAENQPQANGLAEWSVPRCVLDRRINRQAPDNRPMTTRLVRHAVCLHNRCMWGRAGNPIGMCRRQEFRRGCRQVRRARHVRDLQSDMRASVVFRHWDGFERVRGARGVGVAHVSEQGSSGTRRLSWWTRAFGRPILQSYSSDGAPRLTLQRFRIRAKGAESSAVSVGGPGRSQPHMCL